MRFFIEDLEVLFPFDYIYPEQLQYMRSLKQSLGNGHALLEMPTGTGKTITLLSLLLAYQYKYPEVGKIVYCTRTVHEMNKVLAELDNLMKYRTSIITADQHEFSATYPDLAKQAIEILTTVGVQAFSEAQDKHSQQQIKLEQERLEIQRRFQHQSAQHLANQQQQQQKQEEMAPISSQQPSPIQSSPMNQHQADIAAAIARKTKLAKMKFKRTHTSISIDDEDDLLCNPNSSSNLTSLSQFNKSTITMNDDDDDIMMVDRTQISTLNKPILTNLPIEERIGLTTNVPMPHMNQTNISPGQVKPGTIGFDYNIIDDPNVPVKSEEVNQFLISNPTSGISGIDISQQSPHNTKMKPQTSQSSMLRSYIVQQSINLFLQQNQHNGVVTPQLATYAIQLFRSPSILGLCLSGRTNMCIHPFVGSHAHREKVDTLCRAKTASYVREKALERIVKGAQGQSYTTATHFPANDKTAGTTGVGDISRYTNMTDDTLPPPLEDDEAIKARSNITTMNDEEAPSTANTASPPCGTGSPCTDCPSVSSKNVKPGQRTVNIDIEDLDTLGLCPYYEGYLSVTKNRSHTYSASTHTQQLANPTTSTPGLMLNANNDRQYVDSVSLNITQTSSKGITEIVQNVNQIIPEEGIFDIHALISVGKQHNVCPYYLTRYLISSAHIVVYNYHYMLDPKVNAIVDKHLENESIVVFDEAHNIDNICIEALSITVTKNDIYQASRCIEKLRSLLHDTEKENEQLLINEYQQILQQIQLTQSINFNPNSNPTGSAVVDLNAALRFNNNEELSEIISSPTILPPDLLQQALPGNIRKGRNFILFCKSILEFLKNEFFMAGMSGPNNNNNTNQPQQHYKIPNQHTPKAFLEKFKLKLHLHDITACKYLYDRLALLLNTLHITDYEFYVSLIKIASFITLTANYEEGFVVLYEPFDDNGILDQRIELCCVDASIAIQPLFKKYSSVVITSGTLSPMDMYPKMLGFTPYISQQFTMSLNRHVVLPLIITQGSDQSSLSTSYDTRGDTNVLNQYGNLLVQLSKNIPDGIVVFFPSYAYMENILLWWNEAKFDPKTGKIKEPIISSILRHKLIFVETKDIEETTLSLAAYKKACDNGRGAVFFSIARGKVSEGIDFSGHYGRAVVMVGIPYQYTRSRVLLSRLYFLEEKMGVNQADYLNFDALRQTSQCLGRIVRSKKDYGLMILADDRYNRQTLRNKLPRWIQSFIRVGHSTSLSIDSGCANVKQFLRDMSTPHDIKYDYGTVLLNQQQAAQHLANLE